VFVSIYDSLRPNEKRRHHLGLLGTYFQLILFLYVSHVQLLPKMVLPIEGERLQVPLLVTLIRRQRMVFQQQEVMGSLTRVLKDSPRDQPQGGLPVSFLSYPNPIFWLKSTTSRVGRL
jgi:hypothetical protein